MTSDEYILSVISKYRLFANQDSPAYRAAVQLYPTISEWANKYLIEVTTSGSYAKGTGIKGSTDIDLFISLKSDTPVTLKEIYENLYKWLFGKKLAPRKQNVSIGLNYSGISIDLVPAKKQFGNTNDRTLYKNKSQSWTQTNVQTHIKLISESDRLNEILAIKIWRNLRRLSFPSFYLELTVLDALYRKPTDQLGSNVWAVLFYLRDRLKKARVIDPANSNNVISEDLTVNEKSLIESAAKDSCSKSNWQEILW